MKKSVQHDCAFAGAKACLEVVAGCIREEEHRDAAEAFYEIIKACLERFECKMESRDKRIYPRKN
jgi:hypothetical protein